MKWYRSNWRQRWLGSPVFGREEEVKSTTTEFSVCTGVGHPCRPAAPQRYYGRVALTYCSIRRTC